MSQVIFNKIDPEMSGEELADVLNDFKDALMSGLSGTTRPTELDAGGYWIDTTNNPTTWSFKLWTGSTDIEVFKIDIAGGGTGVTQAVDTFTVRKVSDDDVGAVLNLIKRRIATSGQVKASDVLADIRFTARDENGDNPVVASIIATAEEDMTDSAFGAKLSIYAVPVGSTTPTEYMKLSEGYVESLAPHIFTGLNFAQNTVTNEQFIDALTSSAPFVSVSNSSNDVELYGIDASTPYQSKQVIVLNTGSKVIKAHNNSVMASAADRLSLPVATFIIEPGESATFVYDETAQRWALQYSYNKFDDYIIHKAFYNKTLTVTGSQLTVTAHIKGFKGISCSIDGNSSVAITEDGTVYSWGVNTSGQLGHGDTDSKSSPVAVSGSIKAKQVVSSGDNTAILSQSGELYMIGYNAGGSLGDGTTVSQSTPVAVIGGYKFTKVSLGSNFAIALDVGGKAFAWGSNLWGQLGTGNTTSYSSPVAVVGDLKFKDVQCGISRSIGLTEEGTAYFWGQNSSGDAGTGDNVSYSSPVAISGGLKFKQISMKGDHVLAITEDGTLYSWGQDTLGETGTGVMFTVVSTPTAVLGDIVFKEVSAGLLSSLGLDESGQVYAWGNAPYVITGGDTASSPIAVFSGRKFESIENGYSSAFARGFNHDIYAWGDNFDGQLGVGDTTSYSSPVAVTGGLSPWGVLSNTIVRVLNVSPGNVSVEFKDSGVFVGGVFIGKNITYLEIAERS